jgi:hypothetical protein
MTIDVAEPVVEAADDVQTSMRSVTGSTRVARASAMVLK